MSKWDLGTQLEAQKQLVQQAVDSLGEAKKGLEGIRNERDRSILSDIVERDKTITSIEGEVVKARKRYELERLASPVDGTVHGLAITQSAASSSRPRTSTPSFPTERR